MFLARFAHETEGAITDRSSGFRDALAILLVCAICSASYLLGLRHYSDDWFFLVPMVTSADQSWSGLYNAMAETPFAAVRPGQILWYIAFHKLAPGNVTLVHVASHAVFAAAVLVMFAALRAIRATRDAAYHVTLLYACLPTFTAARLWYANHQAVLSLLMFALTAWLLTRIVRVGGRGRWLLLPLVFAATLFGNLCYELFAATALALPLFVWWGSGIRPRELLRDKTLIASTAAIALALAVTALFKLGFDYGFKPPGSPVDFARQSFGIYLAATKTTFWTLGLYSPRAAVGMALSPYVEAGALLAPVLVLLVAAVREWLARNPGGSPPSSPIFIALSGFVAFGLGYVPYLVSRLYSPYPWGEGNRGNIAGALGAALLIYAAFRWARTGWPRLATAALVAFCVTGAFLQVAVGRMWVRAAIEQDRILAAFVRHEFADRGTVLVYGTCPYFGAGPIFPYGRDLRGRLILEEGYRGLTADVVRPGMRVLAAGITSEADPSRPPIYRYADLRILDLRDGSVVPIRGAAEARRYFAAHPPERTFTCEFVFGMGRPIY